MTAEKRRCPRCRKRKGLDHFYNVAPKKSGKHVYCKPCAGAIARERRARDPAATRRRDRRNNVAKHGITLEQIDSVLIAQDGRCDICNDPLDHKGEPSIDHDHATGCFRGLLCVSCNRGLGLMKDSAPVLLAAVDYLNRHAPPLSFLMRPDTDRTNPATEATPSADNQVCTGRRYTLSWRHHDFVPRVVGAC